MLREPAADSAASGKILSTATDTNVMIRTSLNQETRQRSIAGQDKTKHWGGVKIKAEILDILKVKNQAKKSKVEKDVVGAAATAKQEHVDSYVRGGVEDGGVNREELNKKKLVPNVNKIIDPPNHYQAQESTQEVGQD